MYVLSEEQKYKKKKQKKKEEEEKVQENELKIQKPTERFQRSLNYQQR